jgi:NADH:ubiquinone oxidoreductase subunit 6 (subunit J)
VLVPIAVAGRRTVPSARRLGLRRDPVHTQAALARAIYRQHLLCLAFIGTLLVVQLIGMR